MKKTSILLGIFAIMLNLGCSKDDGPEVKDPVITISDFESSIEENPVENEILGTIEASTNTGTLVYSLTTESPAGALKINSSTGQLSVAAPSVFVFEINPKITATVQAKVGDVTKTANITINVTEETLDVATAVIDKTGYTAPEDLTFLYSTDGGDSYSADKPTDLTEGDEILVNISNGIMDISKDDFYFSWIGSSPVAKTSEIALAKFVVGSTDLDIKVAVVDKIEILVSDRNTGQFYSLDPSTGDKTEAFTITLDGEDLVQVRGAIYNYADRKMYVSTTAPNGFEKSMLYSVDMATLQATTINSNPNDTWKGLADLVITPQGNIMATMSLGQGIGESLISFDTDGTASAPVAFTGADLCCGLGLTYGDTTNEVWVGDSAATIHKSNLNGEVSETINLTLEDFEYNMPNAYMIKNLVQIDGVLYALCYENDNAITHIAKVDLENNTLVHIAQLSNSNATQVNALVFIPAYLF